MSRSIAVSWSANAPVANQPLAVWRGEDVLLTCTASLITSMSGWAALQWTLKQWWTGSAVLTKTVGAGITITDTVNGIFTVAIAAADTSPLTFGPYVWDVWRIDSGSHTDLASGTLALNPEAQN